MLIALITFFIPL